MVKIATSIKIPLSGSLVALYGETRIGAARLYLVVGFLFLKPIYQKTHLVGDENKINKNMFIVYFIGCIFLGLLLAILVAPILIISNSQKLKEMDKKIEEFENRTFSTQEDKEKAKQVLKKELVKIKAGIVNDKNAIEQAADKISIL